MAQNPAPLKSSLKTTGQNCPQTSTKVSNPSNIEALMRRESGLAMTTASVFALQPHFPIQMANHLVALGHVRLAINDLSLDGEQPFMNPENSLRSRQW
jgi:hypothetical protein